MIYRQKKRNFVGQWSHVKQWQKFCTLTPINVFSNAKKMASRNIFRHFFRVNFFMFVLLISNHTIFSLNLKLICTCEFFKKLKLHSPKRLVQFQLLKNSLVQINSKFNEKIVWLLINNTNMKKFTRKKYDYLY